MRKPRHLSPDERALWDQVAARTDRMLPETAKESGPLSAKPKKAPLRFSPAPFDVGSISDNPSRPHDLLAPVADRLRSAPLNMDAKSFGKMARGKIKPEARIDLHGMTMDQAHPVLVDFIMRAHASGKRLVLVITGKGKMP